MVYCDTRYVGIEQCVAIRSKLDEAERLKESDPFKAYKTYDELLTEASHHTVTDEDLAKRLTQAAEARLLLHRVVEDQLRAEEVEKRRLAENAAKLAAEKSGPAPRSQQRRRRRKLRKLRSSKGSPTKNVEMKQSPYIGVPSVGALQLSMR